jgi:glutaredoxin
MARQRVYLLAALSSIMLYAVGIFTGAAILGYTENKTSGEFASLRQELDGFGGDINSIELELLYLSSGKGELGCKFVISSLNNVQEDLSYFWDKLPQKLEVYESENPPDQDYEQLKKDYMELSLKAWLLSLSVRDKCGSDVLPVLYFYSRDCGDCIEQGEILDAARQSGGVLVYTIDLNLDSEAVSIVKEAYDIQTTPALIIGEDSYQGLVSQARLLKAIREAG